MAKRTLQWLSLVGIIWLQSVNGTNTNFPAYSSQLKQLLSLSQLQLNNLAFASDAGKLFGFVSGFAALHLPLWLVLLVGSTLGLVGYGVQYLFITNYIHSLTYIHVFLLTILAGNSICWINTVCFVVAIRNFPCHRQVAVGLTASYQGLSAKIYTVFVGALFESSSIHKGYAYLLFNSMLPLLVSIIAAGFARDLNVDGRVHCGESNKKMRGGFIAMFGITIATGVFAILSSFKSMSSSKNNNAPPPDTPCLFVNAIGLLAFLLAPLSIPLVVKFHKYFKAIEGKQKRVYSDFSTEENGTHNNNSGGVIVVVLGEETRNNINNNNNSSSNNVHIYNSTNNNENEINTCKEVESGGGGGNCCNESELLVGHVKEEIGVGEMVKRIDFWLYFFVYLFGATVGLVYLNNLGQIAESRGCFDTPSLVALASSFGFFGRLVPSLLDYFFARTKYMISRPATIAISMAPMAGAFLLLLHQSNISLYIGTSIVGICTGAITSIAVPTTTELFGTKNFSVNHNILVANIPIGSFTFGYFAALIYKNQAVDDANGKCLGAQCFRTTFIVWGSLCFVGTFLALLLYVRTRKFYSTRPY